MSYRLIHNARECKYEYHIDHHTAYISYDEQDGEVHLTHTFVPEVLEGKGIAKLLLEDVLEQIKKEHKKAVEHCSYIARYLEKHPQARDYFA